MSRVNLNDMDCSFKHLMLQQPRGQGIKACYACKACAACCPVTALDNSCDPRRIIRMAALGMKKEILQSDFIWLCTSCYRCQDVCPQKVRLTEIIFAMKNLAVTEAAGPPGLMVQRNLLRRHGRLYEIGEFENEKREKLGLPPVVEHPEDYRTLLAEEG